MLNKDLKDKASKTKLTQGKKKLARHFNYLKKNKPFLDHIDLLRKLIDKYNKEHNGEFIGDDKYWGMIEDICKEFDLPVFYWRYAINYIVRFDDWNIEAYEFFADICVVTDYETIKSGKGFISEIDKESYEKGYPVLIGISPYASKKDVLDFIEKKFTGHIAPKLKEYKKEGVKIGGVRSRAMSKRDNFIFEHRRLPYSEFCILYKENFDVKEVPGYDYIGKIVRKEKKERGVTD